MMDRSAGFLLNTSLEIYSYANLICWHSETLDIRAETHFARMATVGIWAAGSKVKIAIRRRKVMAVARV
jgi:hypothetical protein